MSPHPQRVTIVGCGPGSPAYLTGAARAAVASADAVLGSPRLLAMFPEVAAGKKSELSAHVQQALEQVALRLGADDRVAVLVSGDPGLFSLAQPLFRHFGPDVCTIVAGISSVQVALARFGLAWPDTRTISLHGRNAPCLPTDLSGSGAIAILAGEHDAFCWASQAAESLCGSHRAFVCENLTLDGERVAEVNPRQLVAESFGSLAIILLIPRSLLP